jgi:hypothetical protein
MRTGALRGTPVSFRRVGPNLAERMHAQRDCCRGGDLRCVQSIRFGNATP